MGDKKIPRPKAARNPTATKVIQPSESDAPDERPGALLSKWVRHYSVASSSDDDSPMAARAMTFRGLLGGPSIGQDGQVRPDKSGSSVFSAQSAMQWRSRPTFRHSNPTTRRSSEHSDEMMSFHNTPRGTRGNRAKYLEHWLSKMQEQSAEKSRHAGDNYDAITAAIGDKLGDIEKLQRMMGEEWEVEEDMVSGELTEGALSTPDSIKVNAVTQTVPLAHREAMGGKAAGADASSWRDTLDLRTRDDQDLWSSSAEEEEGVQLGQGNTNKDAAPTTMVSGGQQLAAPTQQADGGLGWDTDRKSVV